MSESAPPPSPLTPYARAQGVLAMAINELRQTCPTLVESCNENAAEYARRTVLLREHGIHPELKEAATGKGLPETTPALLLRVEKSLRAYADAVHDFRKALIRSGGRH